MNRLLNIFSVRKLRNRNFQTRIILILGFLLLMTLILPRSFRLNLQYKTGQIWPHEDLSAPYDFFVLKDSDSLQAEREIAAQQVADIFVLDTSRVAQSERALETNIRALGKRLSQYRQAAAQKDSLSARRHLRQFFQPEYADFPISRFPNVSDYDAWTNQLIAEAKRYAKQVYEIGYLNTPELSQSDHFVALRTKAALEKWVPINQLLVNKVAMMQYLQNDLNLKNGFNDQLLAYILQRDLEANYIFNEALTESERDHQRNLVSSVSMEYQQGDPIVDRGEIVSPEIEKALTALIQERQKRAIRDSLLEVSLSQFLVIALISAILLVYLAVDRPRIYFDNNKLGLIFFTFVITVGLMVLAARIGNVVLTEGRSQPALSFIYLAPACLVPIFMRNFFGLGTAFLCNLLVAFFGAVLIQQDLEYAFVQTVAGTVAIYSMTNLRKREQFWYTLLYICIGYMLSFLIYNLYSKGGFRGIAYPNLLLFMGNALATVIAFNLIFLFEKLFGITSDLTYLELLDTNHSLLKELARKAPGTFQHSLQVANLAESIINEIGGNELLTHVGALYHDVGKMPDHQFFIENMSEEDKRNSPHDAVSDLESARIIIGHVAKGVELATRHHLPKEIIQFIQTHHGSTRVEYFYRNFLKEKAEHVQIDESAFRYPGPKPFSKETAALMIADSVEAASRAMSKPTPEKLKKLVDSIINYKIEDGQLEDCNLTFKDITTIRKVLHKKLLSIYHARIEYPEEVKAKV
ncbi:MAG: HDIG domain-containing metalloprotein [Bacteroidota bacterium]